MLLIVSQRREAALTVRDMFALAGFVTEVCEPKAIGSVLTHAHHGVILVGRRIQPWVVDEIRGTVGLIPIFALRDDLCTEGAGVDRIYPSSILSFSMHEDMILLAKERGIKPIGDYSLGVLSARAYEPGASFLGKRLPLTRSELAILRRLIAKHPMGQRGSVLCDAVFKESKRPTDSGVRTHICSINKKATEAIGTRLIESGADGYILSVKEALTV